MWGYRSPSGSCLTVSGVGINCRSRMRAYRCRPHIEPAAVKDVLHIMERIAAAGAGFRSITENIDTTTPAGRMMMQMVGAFAEFKRAMIRERTSAGLAAAQPYPSRHAVHGGRFSQSRTPRQNRGECRSDQPGTPDTGRRCRVFRG